MITILPFAEDHLEPVLAIEQKDGDAHWTSEHFKKELSGEVGRFFVLQDSDQGDIVGYGGYWKAGEEEQITNLVIRQDHRCQGLGRRMLEFMLDCARSEACKICTLEVRQGNRHAQALYKAVGFTSTGVRAGVYHNPEEDAVLMEKVL